MSAYDPPEPSDETYPDWYEAAYIPFVDGPDDEPDAPPEDAEADESDTQEPDDA